MQCSFMKVYYCHATEMKIDQNHGLAQWTAIQIKQSNFCLSVALMSHQAITTLLLDNNKNTVEKGPLFT